MKSAQDSILRHYTPEDKKSLLLLYEKVWGRKKADQISIIWDWKYHEHPLQPRGTYHSLVVEKKGAVIGFLGAFPARLKLGGNLYDGLWLADYMVDKEHRGAASGVRLGRTILDTVPVLIGHADNGEMEGAISYKLWKRLKNDKIEIAVLPNLMKRVSIREAIRQRIKIRPAAMLADSAWRLTTGLGHSIRSKSLSMGIAMTKIEKFTQGHSGFLNALMEDYANIPIKSVDYLNWRFFSRPGASYTVLLAYRGQTLAGYAAFRCVDEDGKINGRIVDLLVRKGDRGAAATLLSEAEKRLRNEGSRVIKMYGFKDAVLQGEVERAGYFTKGVSSPSIIMVGQCPDSAFFNENDWYFSLSDGDFEMD